MMRRREFILGLSVVAASIATSPHISVAQRGNRPWRIGFIGGASRESTAELWPGIPQGLQELGYAEGKDYIIEWRYAHGNYDLFPSIAAELVELKVDVFVLGTPAAVRPVQKATSTIPIVLASSIDPVGNGFVASLAHPGGQITGLASMQDDYAPKQLELLAAVVPNLDRVGFLLNIEEDKSLTKLSQAQATARRVGIELVPIQARSFDELDRVWGTFVRERVNGVIVPSSALYYLYRQGIAQSALANHLPTMFDQNEYAEAGGLMSYGENLKEFYRRSGRFVDKIFKGAKPGDLPIEQPTRFELVINRKVADALGLTIPETLLATADEVIQ
jgi:putative tryptophan/tyrosine transport system substrate-binding protein